MTGGRDPVRRWKASGLLRWSAAAVVVAAVHGAGAWAAFNWYSNELALPNDSPPAVMIDLAPLAVAPDVPAEDVAPGPHMIEAQPVETPDTADPVHEDPGTTPAPVNEQESLDPDPPVAEKPEPVEPEESEPAPPISDEKLKVPDLPETEEADAVLAPVPTPRPKIEKERPAKKTQSARKKTIRPDKPQQRQTSAPPPSTPARRSTTTAAPSSGAGSISSVSPATWKGKLIAHLNRYKRYPAGASGHGTASVAFVIDRAGQVLSARLIGSSGDTVLDRESIALLRRADPLPPPPPAVGGGGSITLTLPIRFNR